MAETAFEAQPGPAQVVHGARAAGAGDPQNQGDSPGYFVLCSGNAELRRTMKADHAWGGSGPAISSSQGQNNPENICQNICLEEAQGRDLPGPDTDTLSAGTAPGLASAQVPAVSGETSSNPSQHTGKPHQALEKKPKYNNLANRQHWQPQLSPAKGQLLRGKMSPAEERL